MAAARVPSCQSVPRRDQACGTSYVTQLTSEQLITGRYRCWQESFDRMGSRVPVRTCEQYRFYPHCVPPCSTVPHQSVLAIVSPTMIASPSLRFSRVCVCVCVCVQLKRRKGNVIASHDTPPLIRVYTLPYFGGIDTSYASVS